MSNVFKLRIETDDGYHVLSLSLIEPLTEKQEHDLMTEMRRAFEKFPERKAAGLLNKTYLLGRQ